MRLLTTDLHEGAWLLSQGMELVKLYPVGNGKKTIVFEFSGQKAEGILEQYRKGKAEGNVWRFKQATDELKDRMFGLIREREIIGWRQRKRGGSYAGVTQEIFK